jgi:preprotein translocase subunit SecF
METLNSLIKIDFIRFRFIAFMLSLLLSVGSVVLIFSKGLEFGIDFTGGIVMEARFEHAPDLGQLRTILKDGISGEVALQNLGNPNDIMVRVQQAQSHDNSVEVSQSAQVLTLKKLLEAQNYGEITYRKVDYVGPQVSSELLRDGAIALLLAFGGIMLYVWFRFEWQFGVGAIIALAHDAVMTMGFYAITGIEFDISSVAAVLTIVGYSVNDSVVIYDRIRENLRKYKKVPLTTLINVSVNETLSRTLLTVSTTLASVLALVLLGGPVIQGFALAMLFGIVVGTYSSIYISAPVLLYTGIRSDEGAIVPITGEAKA